MKLLPLRKNFLLSRRMKSVVLKLCREIWGNNTRSDSLPGATDKIPLRQKERNGNTDIGMSTWKTCVKERITCREMASNLGKETIITNLIYTMNINNFLS